MGIKKIKLIIIMIFSCIVTSGCYDAMELDNMAYAVAIGLDKGKSNNLKMTFQIVKTTPSDGEGEEKGGGSNIVETSIETPTIYSGMNMINNYVTKRINVTHAKAIIISKELAEEGLDKYINAFERGRQFRGNMYVAIARGTAEDFIKAAKPQIQSNSSRLFEAFFTTYKFTGLSVESTLTDIFTSKASLCSNPVASLVGVNEYESTDEFSNEKSTYLEKGKEHPFEGDYKAGDLPKTHKYKAENMGLAVFDNDRMIGEMDGEEATMYLMNTGKYKHSYITLDDPLSPGDFVVMDVRQNRKPVRVVNIEGDAPKISTKINLEANILSIQSGINYEDPEKLTLLEEETEKYFEKMMLDFLNKTASVYKSDICSYGREVKKKFLTFKEWSDYKWLDKYEDSNFEVDVSLKVRRTGLLIKTFNKKPGQESE